MFLSPLVSWLVGWLVSWFVTRSWKKCPTSFFYNNFFFRKFRKKKLWKKRVFFSCFFFLSFFSKFFWKLSNLQKSNFHPKKKKMAKISKTGIFLKKGFKNETNQANYKKTIKNINEKKRWKNNKLGRTKLNPHTLN